MVFYIIQESARSSLRFQVIFFYSLFPAEVGGMLRLKGKRLFGS